MVEAEETHCPLCQQAASPLMRVKEIIFCACETCGLRFKNKAYFPNPADEKAQYDCHENNAYDAGYRRFLGTLTQPLSQVLPQGAQLLDFGSGPVATGQTPTLAMMMQEQGFAASFYDPFYHDDPACLTQDYDAVTATEVIEHFHYPRNMFDRLDKLIRPGGWLAVMTAVYNDTVDFATWHYHRDPTHVAFYRAETFHWIAHHYGYTLNQPHKNVALFQKAFSFRPN